MISDKTGGPAYPGQELNVQFGTEPINRGMTLLDYFAGQVLLGLTLRGDYYDHTYEQSAVVAYDQAEAMIAEKAKREATDGE